MKIVLAGGSGYLGSIIAQKYYGSDTEVVVLTRGKEKKDKNITYVQWDAQSLGAWVTHLENSALVINLTGKSVNCRYNEKNKKEIIESRVNSTLIIGKAINSCINPPQLWINAGSAAIFGDAGDEVKYEESATGNGFSAEVCKRWEEAFYKVETPKTRKVYLRIGLVFGKDSWVLTPFLTMAKWGIGGAIGSGDQFVTWIHKEDFLNLLDWVYEKKEISGVIHVSSPKPVKNSDFMKILRKSYSMPIGIPHPSMFIKMGAVLIGTEAELVLTGRRVVSRVLEQHRFDFRYPKLEEAIHNIVRE